MTEEERSKDQKAFIVAPLDAMLGALIHKNPGYWVSMGDLESRLLRRRIDQTPIDRPVFISGLARWGTTILLELFSQLESVCTHQYRDFPPVFTPYCWNWLVDRTLRQTAVPTERAHGDRIEVTPESPEAFEEPVWMAFFPNIHDPHSSNLLDTQTSNPEFERFYRDHIRKLLIVRKASRYVSKGNYNISRLQYLRKTFPDARFVIPVRDPVTHIASMMKQHSLFRRATQGNPKARNHLRWVGHYEFGQDRVPINMGDTTRIEEILGLWEDGEEIRGWARYWNHIYGAVAQQLDHDSRLRETTIVIPYEEFCHSPVETVRNILRHTDFHNQQSRTEQFCAGVSLPSYYTWPFSDKDLEIIHEETSETVREYRLTPKTSASPTANIP